MVEQAKAAICHHHPICVACLDDILVAQRAARLDDVGHAVLRSAVDGIAKGNVGV